MAVGVGVRVTTATLVVVVALVVAAEAYPTGQGEEGGLAAFRRSLFGSGTVRRTQNQCTNNAMQQHTCEMCEKETKSQQVYTLCCTGEADALMWCQSFLRFGII